MIGKHSFDTKCLDLAEYFMPEGDDKQKHELAHVIQEAVEDWLDDNEIQSSDGVKHGTST